MSPKRYLPKITMNTAKQVAKDLLSTRSGKKLTDSQLKNFIKKDPNLKSYSYSQPTKNLSKLQTKKFLQSVVSAAKENQSYKVSLLGKKLGIKKDALPKSTFQKVYQQATDVELKKNEPTGPSKEEIAKQRRREEAIKSFHKHERAHQIEQEKRQTEQPHDGGAGGGRQPVQMQGGVPSVGGVATATTAAPALAQGNVRSTPGTLRLLLLPLENRTPSIEGAEFITEKMNRALYGLLLGTRLFSIIRPADLETVRQSVGITGWPASGDLAGWRSICSQTGLEAFIHGSVAKTAQTIKINITLTHPGNDRTLTLANLEEPAADLFELERKARWEIGNALQGTDTNDSQSTPPPREVQEMPI